MSLKNYQSVMIERYLSALLILTFFVGSVENSRAQNKEPPKELDSIIKIANSIKMGLQIDGEVQSRNWTVADIEKESLTFLNRPVDGGFSFAMPVYGVGLSLRYSEAEVAFSFQDGSGVQFRHWVQFQDDSDAFPFRPNYRNWSFRAEYFFSDWVGVGTIYQQESISISPITPFRVQDDTIDDIMLSGGSDVTEVALYVPVRRKWNGIRFFGRVGSSLFGQAQGGYFLPFVQYQDPDQPARKTNQQGAFWRQAENDASGSPNHQFARVGVEIPVWQTTIRPVLEVERLQVPGFTKTWSYNVQVEIGLPF